MTSRRSISCLLIACVLAILLPGCAAPVASEGSPAQAVIADSSGPITLPSRRCANYFLLDATINGRGPFTLLLDTGASRTVLTPRAADRLSEFAYKMDARVRGSQGATQPVTRGVRINTMTLGTLTLESFDAMAVDLSKVQAVLGTRIDGILGYPAFADLLLTIDYPTSSVRVSRGRLPPVDHQFVLPLASRSRPVIEVRIADEHRDFLLDSGKASGFSFEDFERQKFSSPPATIAMGVAIGGSYELHAGRLADDITLGAITFRTPVIEDSDASNLIGVDALKRFSITFDQRNRRVRFEPAGDATVHFPPIRGIGVGFEYDDGFWTVSRIFPGLPAETTDLQSGDIVVRLAGRRLRDLACTRQTELYETANAIEISVIRDRRRMDVKVPVMTLVP